MVSSDLVRDASSTPQHLQSPEMELQSINESSRALAADKAEALTVLPRNKIDKHSMNFVVRSGIAGGIAGCAVRDMICTLLFHCSAQMLIHCWPIGQNCRWSPRPGEDPLPGVESGIRQVFRLMVGPGERHARTESQRGVDMTLSRPFCHTSPHFPLRRHQVPCLRAISCASHSFE